MTAAIFNLVSLVICLAYAFFILFLRRGWIKTSPFKSHPSQKEFPFITVVIAFRNDGPQLQRLIGDLIAQSYPPDRFEVIVVNDHSDDGWQTPGNLTDKSFVFIDLPEGLQGKKSAVEFGIGKAIGEAILFTDADCRVQPGWIASFSSFYIEKGKPDMVIGLVGHPNPANVAEKAESLEMLALVASAAGAAAIGHPIYCNGANLMVRKASFLTLHDPLVKKYASGDDTFLLHSIKGMAGARVTLLKAHDAMITTMYCKNLSGWLSQRLRWASKGKHYRDAATIIVGLLIIMTNLVLAISLPVMVLKGNLTYLGLYAIKTLADLSLLLPASHFFGNQKSLLLLPLLQLVYPYYIIGVAMASQWTPFAWKGRHYNK